MLIVACPSPRPQERDLTLARLATTLRAALPNIISISFDAHGADAETRVFLRDVSERLTHLASRSTHKASISLGVMQEHIHQTTLMLRGVTALKDVHEEAAQSRQSARTSRRSFSQFSQRASFSSRRAGKKASSPELTVPPSPGGLGRLSKGSRSRPSVPSWCSSMSPRKDSGAASPRKASPKAFQVAQTATEPSLGDLATSSAV